MGKTLFHTAAEENSKECMKLLVYHFKVDPDEPDEVDCKMTRIMDQPATCVLLLQSSLVTLHSIML